MRIMIIFLFIVIFLALAFVAFRLFFLRNPKRDVPKGDCIVSPANGKVVRIIRIREGDQVIVDKGVFGKVRDIVGDVVKDGFLVVIMMTPLNVHYQRSPVDGVVEKTKYTKGCFNNAMSGASNLSCLENEKNEITIRNSGIGKVKVIQVAGFLARRIHCFVRKGQKINKGEDIGLISLGSQVLLVMPKLDILVTEGQTVIDCETVIARF
jgi:phosphatidylserine decarboxylase